MPPKRLKGHELADIVKRGSVIVDTRKQRFVVGDEFARGGFGRIYSGHQEGSSRYGKPGSLAIKMEPQTNGPLFTEITVFQRILMPDYLKHWMEQKNLHHIALPPYVSSGIYRFNDKALRFLILPKYSKSLEEVIESSGGKLKTDAAFIIAKQCADCLSYMQNQNYVHADVKAGNILLASPNSFTKVYLVDFGLAKMVKNAIEKPDKRKAHNGTLFFTSIDAHRGCSPSFRGDLEILLYNVMFWVTGSLPWTEWMSKPDKVFTEKLLFQEDYHNIVTKSFTSSAAVHIIALFKIAYETHYASKIDYNQVCSIFDKLVKETKSHMSSINKSSEKRKRQSVICQPKLSDARSNSITTSDKEEDDALEAECSSRRSRRSLRLNSTAKAIETSCSEKISLTNSKRSRNRLETREDSSSPFNSPPRKRKMESKGVKRSANTRRKQATNLKSIEKKPSAKNSEVVQSFNREDAPSTEKILHEEQTDKLESGNSAPDVVHKVPASPDREISIRQIIPGVRNMKTVRRSLEARLLKKYVNKAKQS